MALIKWILTLTQKRPVLGLVAALLIGISATSAVSVRIYTDYKASIEQNREDLHSALDTCAAQKFVLYQQIFALRDTITVIQARGSQEVIRRVDAYNKKLQDQLDAQRRLNNKQYKAIQTNEDVILTNKQKLNKLKDETGN